MSRPLRIDLAGGWYHAMARGIERRAIVRDDDDREHWRELLASLPQRFGVRVHAWALMEKHYHLQLETPEANLSRAMQWLNVSYAVWFNRKYRRVGPLFAGRFRAEITDTEKWVAEVNRYIHLDPVRTAAFRLGKRDAALSKAGRSAGAKREKVRVRLRLLRNYRWSSTRAYLAVEAAPSWLTVDVVRAQFGGRTKKDQIRAYRQALEEAIEEGVKKSPWEEAVGGLILGGKQFVEEVREKMARPGRESRRRKPLLAVPDFRALRDLYCERRGEPWKKIRDRHGDAGRDLVLLAGREFGRKTLKELAREVGVEYGTVSNALYRIRKRMEKDRKLRKEWRDYCKCINQET